MKLFGLGEVLVGKAKIGPGQSVTNGSPTAIRRVHWQYGPVVQATRGGAHDTGP